ncbi:pentatricopeptide repeat-containing protein At3g20730 isoform X2 [Pistacia vera]|nr:pentatricopeptide repeat-containing protein At3g20730 isoform X2 [Pistacia vera]
MISGYTQSGFYEDALLVFKGMCRGGVRANLFTFGSALRACIGMGRLSSGMQIQGCVEKGRFGENLFVKSALLDLHAKCGRIEDAWLLFKTMKERDVVSWNAMIGGFSFQGFVDDSLRLFRSMMREGYVPDWFTLGSVIRASIAGIGLMNVTQIHGLIVKLSSGSSNILIGSLIDAYAKCGNIRSAYQLYKNLVKKDIVSCTALISGFAREKNFGGEALDLFKEMILKTMEIDDVILCLMFNICANMASLSLGKQIHALALKCQPSYDVAMGNALIDMYAKSGEIEDARRAFDEMGEKNVISWTSLIAGYGKHGYGHKAIALYEKMEFEGLKPNDVTFLSLLFACSHTGLNSEGWELFNNMVRKHKIVPRDEHFSCVVDLFARGGHLESAYDMICKMNIKPSASLWSAILGACIIYGNTSLGELAAMNLFSMEPESSVNYVVLSSIYATAGEWDNAWKTRKLMEERCLRKSPGSSFL